MSVYANVSGDTRYHEPFQVSGYMDRTFEWTQPELARFISDQLAARPEGPHCENTKIWPFCVSATGLGLLQSAAGAGALVGALFIASLAKVRRRGRIQLAMLLAFGLVLELFSLSRSLPVSLVLVLGTLPLVLAGARASHPCTTRP